MKKYTIQLNYNASIIEEVHADDEGEALDKARDLAEDADIRQFTIGIIVFLLVVPMGGE